MTIAQVVSNVKCELAKNYAKVVAFDNYGIRCAKTDYDFSLTELELFLLENIHYLNIKDDTLLLQRNYKNLCTPDLFSSAILDLYIDNGPIEDDDDSIDWDSLNW